jgi:tryptophan synthase alpha chain
MKRIVNAFKTPPALMPYFTLGYPDFETSLACIQAAVDAGADLIELGMPFSDPLADGPVIQRSTQIALENGMTTAKCLEAVRRLRESGVKTPLVLMGYFNPILSYRVKRFVSDAAEAGADGFIIPDLPLEESAEMASECAARDLAYIFMLAPTSTDERVKKVAQHANGFVYLVSVAGVTGERANVASDLENFVSRVKAAVGVPVAVGFGISTAAHARQVGSIAEGVIIGSAVIKAASESNPVEGVRRFIGEMKRAI